MINNYIKLKQELLKKEYSFLNAMQQKAVFTANGPLLILAGAGSGKTTVLINRIAYILEYGDTFSVDNKNIDASDMQFLNEALDSENTDRERLVSLLKTYTVRPWNVLAITFTNKAANELKERLKAKLGDEGANVNCGTFHSICVRILRRNIERLGYNSSFTIYDTDDSVRVIKDCLSALNVDEKMFPPKMCLSHISKQKDSMITPAQYVEEVSGDFRLKVIANVYLEYQKRLKASNAVDFDDIIALTVKLLEENEDVLSYYHNLYKYVLVDEYQDTNQLQYQLVTMLSSGNRNLCVVGDDDQSIYKFRGATIKNILNFEEQFEDAVAIRLEQNYRSTQNILDAANHVIKNNATRKGKNLWTDNGIGDKIQIYRSNDDNAESAYITKNISENIEKGLSLNDHAILYRMNFQSANIERALIKSGITYKVVGGTKFFDRKEIKDILSYMQILNNRADNVRLKRIINEPKRGLGDSTIKTVENMALQLGMSMFDVMANSETYSALSKKSAALTRFTVMMDELSDLSLKIPLDELLDEIMEKTTYRDFLNSQGVEGRVRLENIEELKSNLVKYSSENEEASLSGFLEEVALFTDLDNLNESEEKVTLMTMHSAKGLEFPVVFLIGLEEGIFPSRTSAQSEEEIEEERRLAYVGITRAKRALHLTSTAQRMMFGRTERNSVSRFIKELPENTYESTDATTDVYERGYNSGAQVREKPVFNKKEVSSAGIAPQAEQIALDYAAGDSVMHKMFGKGLVLSIKSMGNDNLVEVSFEKVGTKKIMANFAKLTKV